MPPLQQRIAHAVEDHKMKIAKKHKHLMENNERLIALVRCFMAFSVAACSSLVAVMRFVVTYKNNLNRVACSGLYIFLYLCDWCLCPFTHHRALV